MLYYNYVYNIKFSNDIIGLILKTIIAFVVSNFILILLTAKTKEFKYFKNIIFNLIRKKS